MSIELGILAGMILLAAAATVLWLRRAGRKLDRLLDPEPLPGEDDCGCPCGLCTELRLLRSRPEGGTDE